ncbi:MAG: hypothetical protein WKG07_22875 [Hymenobacter sp.]
MAARPAASWWSNFAGCPPPLRSLPPLSAPLPRLSQYRPPGWPPLGGGGDGGPTPQRRPALPPRARPWGLLLVLARSSGARRLF